jgi:hypothetical protein
MPAHSHASWQQGAPSRPRARSTGVPISCTDVRAGAVCARSPPATDTISPLDIEYSPCPVRTTKSLVALRRRITDVFVQSCQGVGTLHPPHGWSHSNPLHFALAQDRSLPYPISLDVETHSDVSSRRLIKSPDGQCADVPLKLRRKDPSLCSTDNRTGTHEDRARGRPGLEDTSSPKEPLSNGAPLSPLSRNMASLRLSSGPGSVSILKPAPRITPPSPFLNSTTFVSNVTSANQNQRTQVPGHDVTDPKFLSVYSMLDSADFPFKTSDPETTSSFAEISRNQQSLQTSTSQGPVNRVLCYPEESPLIRRDAPEEVCKEETKRSLLRRVRTVTSNSEEGPPVKVQPLVVAGGQLMAQAPDNRDTSCSCSSPNARSGRRGANVTRTRKGLRQSSVLMRGGMFAVEEAHRHSACPDDASPRLDLYPPEESVLRRQGGFRRRSRKVFRSSTASDSCLLSIPARTRDKLPALTLPNGIPSPLSPGDSSSWCHGNHVGASDDSKCYDASCHPVGLPKTGSLQTSGQQHPLSQTSSVIRGLNSGVSCLYMPPQFGLTLSKGIPSPPSPTNLDDDQYCSSIGIAGIQPLSTSSAPPGGNSVVMCRQKKGTADETVSPSSDDTWNSHNHQLMKAPRHTDRRLLTDATPERGDSHTDVQRPDSSVGKDAAHRCDTQQPCIKLCSCVGMGPV